MIHTNDHWQPRFYQSHSDFQWNSSLALFPKINFPTKGGLLDIGSGDGKITAQIAQSNPQLAVIGIDLSTSMVTFAKEKYNSVSNLSFKQLDAHYLAIGEAFDCIVSFWTLGWLIDHGLFITRCYEKLNPGGRLFLFGVENHTLLKGSIDIAADDTRWCDYFKDKAFHENYASFMLYKELIELHQLAGLEVVRHNVSQVFPSSDAFREFIASWLHHLSVLPESQQQPFLDMVVTDYQRKRISKNENPLSFDCTGFIVKGTKC